MSISLTPSGKTYYSYPVDHYQDNYDPHGSALTQTNLIVGTLLSGNNGHTQGLLLSGNIVTQRIEYKDITAREMNLLGVEEFRVDSLQTTVLSGISLALSGNSVWTNSVTMTSGSTLDGRDVSADGTRLDTHLINYSNPHQTTIAQLSGLNTYGDTLSGNLSVSSGISVDGIDVSILEQFIDGSTIPNTVHYHSRSFKTNSLKQFIIPEYSGVVFSGNDFRVFQSDWDTNHNCYVFSGTSTDKMAHVITSVVLPNHFNTLNYMLLNYKPVPLSAASDASIDVTIRDSNGNICSQTGGRNLTGSVGGPWISSLVSGISGTFTAGDKFITQITLKTNPGSKVMMGEIVMDYDEVR